MSRRTAATALTVVATILLVAASVAGYAQRALLDSDQFADRATAALRDPAVRDGPVAGAALETVRPDLVGKLEQERDVVVTRERLGTTTADLVRFAHRVKVLAWVLAALTLACAAAALWLAPDRREAASRLGF